MTKSNDPPRRSQRPFGRVPVDVLPAVSKLRHLDAHVFLVGCILGNRFQGELGLVPVSKTQLAKFCNTSRNRLRDSLARLESLGLVELQSSGWLFMRHYMEGGTSSTTGTSGTNMAPQVPEDGTSGTTETPQVEQNNGDNGAQYVYTNISSNGSSPKKRKRPAPKVIWNAEENRCKVLDDEWKEKFRDHWIPKLGEDRYYMEIDKANNWLANPGKAGRRSSNSRLDMFLWNWMANAV